MSANRRRLDRQDDGRRAALIAAAGQVIARDGIVAATTRRIADEAQLPLGTVHYWFSSKEELLEEVLTSALRELQLPGGNDTPSAPIKSLLDGFRETWPAVESDDRGRQIGIYELTTMAMRNPNMNDLPIRQYRRYRESAALVAKQILPDHSSRLPGGEAALAQLLSVVFDGTVLAWLADPEGTRPDAIFVLLDYLLKNTPTVEHVEVTNTSSDDPNSGDID